MPNKYRLSSKDFDRENPNQQIQPMKVYYIAVEGNKTEKEYFEGLSEYRSALGIKAIVDITVLDRASNDGHSAPSQVLELLEEYIELRNTDDLEEDLPTEILKSYSKEFIHQYFNDRSSIPEPKLEQFVNDLLKEGYDIQYRQYLNKYSSDFDEFCIMIDRDAHCHSAQCMKDIVDHCRKKNYHCYIANPCFEFWLLLHLSDVKTEYADKLTEIKANKKVSNKHTFVSNEVSKKAHHCKSNLRFKDIYLPNIPKAIERAKQFKSDEYDLIDHIGCNVWKLIEAMKKNNTV